MLDTIRKTLVPLHPEGYRFVGIFAAITLVLFLISNVLGWLGVVATAWCAYFFRDPARVTPIRSGLIIAPADGRILPIQRAVPPPELQMGDREMRRISIFMNVFDVHVNRIPVDGEIQATHYHPGKFFNASLDKASVHNERQAVSMTTPDGKMVAFVQIAGLVARRIRCDLTPNQAVRAGERFGLIRFGSRVDVYLDDAMVPLVAEGQRTVAGETVLAETHSSEAPREGEVR